jgi:hypothetical protein
MMLPALEVGHRGHQLRLVGLLLPPPHVLLLMPHARVVKLLDMLDPIAFLLCPGLLVWT